MRAFIVRPFGTKENIDFERVERELIQPALARLRASGIAVEGGTTGELTRQGNIREDMFRLLVVSDLVIADVSIHNANAFYELGIRHALVPRHTFLLRSATDAKYPFDLQTDRYFLYDAANPGARVENLATALRSTLAAEAASSPVFQLLTALKPHDRAELVRVPADFREDVDRARREGSRGDLRLFAEEVRSFEWAQEGLRLIGDAQLKLRAFAGARETFETLREAAPDDLQANFKLGTIYQRLTLTESPGRKEELLARSDQAIERALASTNKRGDRAEGYSLLASNAKSRWVDEFRSVPDDARIATALCSAHFGAMLEWYLKGYNQDLNAHYPGLNALGLLKAQIALAQAAPDAWQAMFDDNARAAQDLAEREVLASRLASSLTLALEMDEVMGKRGGDIDPWAASSRADLLLVTLKDRPQRVVKAYREVVKDADRFALEAMRRNLGFFKELGLFEPSLSAALEVVDQAIATNDRVQPVPARVILFTGHMVDTKDRPKDKMRFPPTAKAEATARRLIESAVRAELDVAGATVLGVAGGACGGDILFHEVCHALGVPTQLYLAIPRERFQVTSVQRGGPQWVERYHALCERQVPRVLQPGEPLPRWLADKPDYDVWRRNNHWTMFNVLATGARRLTLIALYNPEREPLGPGGTGHLVAEARNWGFKGVELDARELLAD
jgi:hypothetical protein